MRDGIVIRSAQQQAATLQVNTRTEHVRFRYMHMNPSAMDADGLLNGRRLGEGEKIGVVSNYLDHPNGTSRHLHFDVQVFTACPDDPLWGHAATFGPKQRLYYLASRVLRSKSLLIAYGTARR